MFIFVNYCKGKKNIYQVFHPFSLLRTWFSILVNCLRLDNCTKFSHDISVTHLNGFGGQAFRSNAAPPKINHVTSIFPKLGRRAPVIQRLPPRWYKYNTSTHKYNPNRPKGVTYNYIKINLMLIIKRALFE